MQVLEQRSSQTGSFDYIFLVDHFGAWFEVDLKHDLVERIHVNFLTEQKVRIKSAETIKLFLDYVRDYVIDNAIIIRQMTTSQLISKRLIKPTTGHFKTPKRVLVDQPSSRLHGKRGIAMLNHKAEVVVFFTHGKLLAEVLDPSTLVDISEKECKECLQCEYQSL